MTTRTWRSEFISARQIGERLRLDLATVYQMARTGEIPGAVWRETILGETLYFNLDEVVKWWQSQLEEAGLVTSCVDADGHRHYYKK
jgi:Helix-turn-helix domain